jgi:hypothetical protein
MKKKPTPPPLPVIKEPAEKIHTIAELRDVFKLNGLSKRMRENVLKIDEKPIYQEECGRVARCSLRFLHDSDVIRPSDKITTCSGMLWAITAAGKALADNVRKFNKAMERRALQIIERKATRSEVLKDAA